MGTDIFNQLIFMIFGIFNQLKCNQELFFIIYFEQGKYFLECGYVLVGHQNQYV